MAGTKYNTKEELITALQNRVFKNNNFQTASSGIQTNDLDIVESLWDKNTGFIEFADYGDFLSAKAANELIPGSLYSVLYQGKNVIPGTAVINTNSPDYVPVQETFIFQAISTSKINPLVRSLENENDIILWDTNNNTTEDSAEARTGKVYYRHDVVNSLSAHYDFRSVYFRIGEIETGGSIPTWASGLDWNRNEMVIYNSELRRASYGLTNNTAVDTQNWQQCSKTVPSKWLWKDDASYLNNTIPRESSTVTDRLTFTGSSANIHIGPTTQNDGYNNICFSSCYNIILPKDCYDCYIESSYNVNVSNSINNSLIGIARNTDIKSSSESYLWNCIDSNIGDLINTSISGFTDSKLGLGAEGDNMTYIQKSDIGNECLNTSIHYLTNCSFGNNAELNVLRNVDQSTFGEYFKSNTFVGLKNITADNNIDGCVMDSSANVYNIFSKITLKNGCANITIDENTNTSNVTFGEACSNIDILGTSTLTDVTFGNGCSNIAISGNSNIFQTSFGIKCSGITVTGGWAYQSSIGNNCTTFGFTSSGISSTSIGNNCTSFTLTSSSNIYDSKFGNSNSNLSLAAATINDCTFKNQCQNIDLQASSSITSTTVNDEVAGITLNTNSSISTCDIGVGTNGITLESSAVLSKCTLEGKNSGLYLNTGITVQSAVFAVNNQNKTFSGINGITTYSGFTTETNHTSSKTYGGSVDPEIAESPLGKTVDDANKTKYNTVDAGVFRLTSAADQNIPADMMPRNIPIIFEIQNTDIVTHNVTFGSDLPAGQQSAFVINASKTNLVQIVRLAGYNDKIVIQSNVEL
jgi:hypothetical protein